MLLYNQVSCRDNCLLALTPVRDTIIWSVHLGSMQYWDVHSQELNFIGDLSRGNFSGGVWYYSMDWAWMFGINHCSCCVTQRNTAQYSSANLQLNHNSWRQSFEHPEQWGASQVWHQTESWFSIELFVMILMKCGGSDKASQGCLCMQIPRPRWLEASGRSGVLLYFTPPGLFMRRAALVFHGAYIFRQAHTCPSWQLSSILSKLHEQYLLSLACSITWKQVPARVKHAWNGEHKVRRPHDDSLSIWAPFESSKSKASVGMYIKADSLAGRFGSSVLFLMPQGVSGALCGGCSQARG